MANLVLPSTFNRFPRVHTRDLDVVRARFALGYDDFFVDATSDAAGFEWHMATVALGPVTLLIIHARGDLRIHGAPTSYILGLGAKAPARVQAGRMQVEIVKGRAAGVYSAGMGARWRGAGERLATVMRIDKRFVQGELEALTGTSLRRPVEFELSMRTDGGYGGGIERMVRYVEGELERGVDLHPMVMTSLSEALVRALLLDHPHDHGHLLSKKEPPVDPAMVRAAEEYIEAHAHEPIHIRELSALTRSSGRAIDAAFHAHRGTTLAASIRKARIRLARQRLLAPEPGTTVQGVAGAAGYLDPQRFAAAHRAEFGESPGETLERGLIATGPLPARSRAEIAAAARISLLTPRERDVCALIAQGLLNKQIAGELDISEGMVERHRGRATKKLGIGSAAELGRLWAARGE